MKITTDRTCDLTQAMYDNLGVETRGLYVQIDGVEQQEDAHMDIAKFYERVAAGAMPTTSQVNMSEFIDWFRPILSSGEDILHLCFSSALSGTYSSAMSAKTELEAEFPDRKIYVIDSLSASMGEGLLLFLTVQKAKEGLDIDALAQWVEDNKLTINHWFTVDDLNHLRRGGRVSGAAALLGTMLDIKPVLFTSNEGKLLPFDKKKGRKKALNSLVEHYQNEVTDRSVAFVSHSDCLEDAMYVAEQIRALSPGIHIEINYIGPTIGAHTGKGTVALFYVGAKRQS